jgi:predicted HTH transcriptional regulator
MDWEDWEALVHRPRALPGETSWVEFKENNDNPQELGEYIACLANSAALANQEAGYLLFGVADSDHTVVGTRVHLTTKKVGNEDLEPWLVRPLDPQVNFAWSEVHLDGGRVVIVRIERARSCPVKFKGEAFIRVGSYKKKLKDHSDHERRLWRTVDSYSFEDGSAQEDLSTDEVVRAIDSPGFFELSETPLPESRTGVLETLLAHDVIRHDVENQWQITNVGALLYARDLAAFRKLARKAIRIVQYEGTSRVSTQRERAEPLGYAVGFKGLIGYVRGLLPNSEVIVDGLRMDNLLIPELAIREVLANALIHQDLTMTGAGPLMEIFDDRIEFTNPGEPLLDPLRFIDGAPRSRNEKLARAMRLHRICEERGSGWDKVAFQVELHQLPPPLVVVDAGQTRVTLFAPKPFDSMDRPERVRAMYQHACLCYVSNRPTTNTSVRDRFGIDKRNSAVASRIIRETIDAELIVAYDPTAGARSLRYVPFWADPAR